MKRMFVKICFQLSTSSRVQSLRCVFRADDVSDLFDSAFDLLAQYRSSGRVVHSFEVQVLD